MLSTCEHFASEYHVQFNASKSQHMVVSKNRALRDKVCTLFLNGSAIERTNAATLLGTCIGDDHETRRIDIKATSEMVYKTNTLLSRFSYCSSRVLSRLFDSYCSSFYSSPLWNLEDACIRKFVIAWKKCMKKIWRISQ